VSYRTSLPSSKVNWGSSDLFLAELSTRSVDKGSPTNEFFREIGFLGVGFSWLVLCMTESYEARLQRTPVGREPLFHSSATHFFLPILWLVFFCGPWINVDLCRSYWVRSVPPLLNHTVSPVGYISFYRPIQNQHS
jgi:hypothetical protein